LHIVMQIFLGIVGDDLGPALVSATLGGEPHQAGRKGDAITTTNKRGRVISRPAIAGYWQRVVAFSVPASADCAARDLLSGLTEEASIWRTMSSRFRTAITLHEVPAHQTPDTLFAPDTLKCFDERGLRVVLNED
jgi:hypothetical protein